MRDINMKVTNVRYYQTSRGVGYEAKTTHGTIWNDGDGGPTYFRGNTPEDDKFYSNLGEFDLEELIDVFEGKATAQ